MSYKKNKYYTVLPFSPETRNDDFYVYASVSEMANKEYLPERVLCRTVGVLQSINGGFVLRDLKLPIKDTHGSSIRVSTVFLRSKPKTSIIPYTVQVFGSLQWAAGPVLFARMIQPLPTPTAIMLHAALTKVAETHHHGKAKQGKLCKL